jgi:uncharacterized C2H2 Zn-finger protein
MLPRVHRDTFFRCPRCACGLDASGTRLSCGQCHGTLIPEQELIDQISGEQAKALLAPDARWNGELTEFVHDLGPAIASTEAAFACPRCMTTMTKHQLYTVTLDRCHAHGVWLDGRHELQTILTTAIA